jgi:hypothetical protein
MGKRLLNQFESTLQVLRHERDLIADLLRSAQRSQSTAHSKTAETAQANLGTLAPK